MYDTENDNSENTEKVSTTKESYLLEQEIDINLLFFGSYNHTVDGKGRIIIPSAFRDQLGKDFAIAPTRDLKSIALYPKKEFNKIITEFSKQDSSDPDIGKYIMGFTQFCFINQQADPQGRLLIPPKFRNRMLDKEKDVVSVGELTHVRISKQKNVDDFTDDLMANADEYASNYNKKKRIE